MKIRSGKYMILTVAFVLFVLVAWQITALYLSPGKSLTGLSDNLAINAQTNDPSLAFDEGTSVEESSSDDQLALINATPGDPLNATAEIETANMDVGKAGLTIHAEFSEPSLVWEPMPVVDAQRDYDLCMDQQAIEFGLDGGDLETDRANLGIDCNSGDNTNRFGKLSDGEYTLNDSPSNHGENNDHYESGNSLPSVSTGRLLGYSGPSYDIARIPQGQLGNVVLLNDSLNTENGMTYGLISNTSGSLATNVSVTVNGVSADYPLSLQPGETAAFAVENSNSPTPHADDVEISYTPLTGKDMSRAIVLSGTPGFWSGPAGQIPTALEVANLPADVLAGVDYYETQLILRVPESEQSGIDMESFAIENVKVLVSFLDDNGHVIDQFSPQAARINNDSPQPSTRISATESLLIGFVLPPDAENFAISVGGDPQY